MKTFKAILLPIAFMAMFVITATLCLRARIKPVPVESPRVTPNLTAVVAPTQNPLVLSLPVSAGRMTLTFATWKDMQAAEGEVQPVVTNCTQS